MKSYLKRVWKAHYFWRHLANAELRTKFRRSSLGIFWAFLNPLLLTALLCLVIGGMFKQPWREFAPYVFSGLIVWEFVVSSVIAGCFSIMNAEPYIKQFNHPMAIYALKTVIVNFTTFLIGFAGLFLWIGVEMPNHIGISIISLPISFILLCLLGWPLSMIAALINTKFRDFQQMMAIILQAIWYVSPVFLQASMFKNANLGFMVEYNPVTHILNLFRKPLLQGVFPSIADYFFVIGILIILYAIAIIKVYKEEKNIIYYI